MAKHQNTPHKSNEEASKYHRLLGSRIYCIDVDCIEFGQNGPVAVIDYKYPGEIGVIRETYPSIKWQSDLANTLNIPFFLSITYLDENFPVKMYYVIPMNSIAINRFGNSGAWFSLRKYSQFQHSLRKLAPYPEELNKLSADHQEYPLPNIHLPNHLISGHCCPGTDP